MNGIHTVQVTDTGETLSFFDWLMIKLMTSDEDKVKERFRKKVKQTTEE